MRFTGAAVDSEHSGPWVDAIGKFVINFGYLEYLSYEWLDLLAPSDPFSDDGFGDRIAGLRKLAEKSTLPRALKRSIDRDWLKAVPLLVFRNRIAHGPVVLIYNGGDETRPPAAIASYSKKLAAQGKSRAEIFASLADVLRKSDDVANLARQLQALLDEARTHITTS